ncbi:MAG: molecular chaperone HtpG, partial [Clostridia bacterium]|nr:molecular chaperone HtpG [Clostridia bacterium]
LTELYKKDKEKYESCWKDLATFVKFGCIKDDDFYQKVKDILIFKNLSGEYVSIESCLGEEISEEDAKAGKESKAVYYVSDENKQAQYIKMFKDAGLDALVCDTYIDPHFISYIEYKNPKRVRFMRIDADVAGALKEESGENKEIEELFKSVLEEKKVTVKTEKLKDATVPAVINVSEFMRRMSEMNSFYQMGESAADITLIVNTANPAVLALSAADEEARKTAIEHIYYLALMNYRQLTPEESGAFMADSAKLLEKYLQK